MFEFEIVAFVYRVRQMNAPLLAGKKEKKRRVSFSAFKNVERKSSLKIRTTLSPKKTKPNGFFYNSRKIQPISIISQTTYLVKTLEKLICHGTYYLLRLPSLLNAIDQLMSRLDKVIEVRPLPKQFVKWPAPLPRLSDCLYSSVRHSIISKII